MKRLVAFTIAGFVTLSGLAAFAQEAPPQTDGSMASPAAPPAVEQIPVEQAAPAQTPTLDQFQQTLAPHGRWVTTPEYGNVWVPNAARDASWRPYSNGRWAYTEQGWTFVSADAWGWAPFHYGRWLYYPAHGWSWIPGYRWSPAWVSWRYGGGYVGWAPQGPDGIASSYYGLPSLWLAVRGPHFYRPLFRSYFLPTTYVRGTVFGRTHFAGLPRVGVYYSPPAAYVSRIAGVPIGRVSVYTVAPRNVVGHYNPQARLNTAFRSARIVATPRGGWVGPAASRPTLRPISTPAYRTPYRGQTPSYRAPSTNYRATPSYRPGTPTYRPAQGYRGPASSYRPPAGGYRATPSYRPTPAPSTRTYRAPTTSSARSSSSARSGSKR